MPRIRCSICRYQCAYKCKRSDFDSCSSNANESQSARSRDFIQGAALEQLRRFFSSIGKRHHAVPEPLNYYGLMRTFGGFLPPIVVNRWMTMPQPADQDILKIAIFGSLVPFSDREKEEFDETASRFVSGKALSDRLPARFGNFQISAKVQVGIRTNVYASRNELPKLTKWLEQIDTFEPIPTDSRIIRVANIAQHLLHLLVVKGGIINTTGSSNQNKPGSIYTMVSPC